MRIYPKKGAIVLPVTSAEADSMWEARALVEQWAAPRSFAEGTRIRPRLEELVVAMEEHRADDDLAAFTESDRLFHEVVVDAARQPAPVPLLPEPLGAADDDDAAAMGLSPARMDRAVGDHHDAVALISGDDLDAFVTANDRHLATARHAVQGGLGEDA